MQWFSCSAHRSQIAIIWRLIRDQYQQKDRQSNAELNDRSLCSMLLILDDIFRGKSFADWIRSHCWMWLGVSWWCLLGIIEHRAISMYFYIYAHVRTSYWAQNRLRMLEYIFVLADSALLQRPPICKFVWYQIYISHQISLSLSSNSMFDPKFWAEYRLAVFSIASRQM